MYQISPDIHWGTAHSVLYIIIMNATCCPIRSAPSYLHAKLYFVVLVPNWHSIPLLLPTQILGRAHDFLLSDFQADLLDNAAIAKAAHCHTSSHKTSRWSHLCPGIAVQARLSFATSENVHAQRVTVGKFCKISPAITIDGSRMRDVRKVNKK